MFGNSPSIDRAHRHFDQGETVYYKSPTMYEVDDSIGDIQGKITDHQVRRRASNSASTALLTA